MSKVGELLALRREVVNFFNGLIILTGTYFLSDYVKDCGDYIKNENVVKEILNDLRNLENRCINNGLNIHTISCDVAEKFLKDNGLDINQINKEDKS